MRTPRFRLTVIPFVLAFLVGVASLPALNVVRVDARGLGHEHAQPWRARLRTLRDRLRLASQSRWVMPALATAALVALVALVALDERAALWALPVAFGTTLTESAHAGSFLLGEGGGLGAPSRENITVLSGQNLGAGAVIGRVSLGIGRVSVPTVVGTGTGTATNVYAGPEVEVGSYVLACTAAVTHGGVFSLTTPSGKVLPALTLTPGSGGTTDYRSRHLNFTITDATDFVAGDTFTFVVGTTAPTVIGGTGTGTVSALALKADAKPGNYRVICTEAISHGGRFQVYRGGPNGGESLGEYLMSAGSGTATAFETPYFSFTLTDATDFIVGNYFDVCVYNQLAGGKVVAWDPTTFDGRQAAVGLLYEAVDASLADAAGVIVTREATVIKAALAWGAAITAAQKESAYLDLAARGIIAR